MVKRSGSAPPAADRLTAMMGRIAGVGPWPEAEEAASWADRSGARPPTQYKTDEAGRRPGAQISAKLGALSVKMVSTASATYARIGLGSVEAKVLLALAEGPYTAAAIGKLIGVDRAAVCRAVEALLERDLVLKLEGRLRTVRLTAEGQGLIEAVNRLSVERERRLLAGFSDQEVAGVQEALGRLMLNVPALTALAALFF